MFHWFEKLVREAIHKALNDLASRLPKPRPQGPTAVQLMRVTGVDLAADTLRRPFAFPVTIGMRRVADGGVQRNFVASPTLLPAIAL